MFLQEICLTNMASMRMLILVVYSLCSILYATKAALSSSSFLKDPSQDPRHVSCKDLTKDVATRVFSADGLDDFSQMTLDTNRHQLIVGARNHVLRLELLDLKQLERVVYASDNVTTTICIAKGQTQRDCHNYIRVLLLHRDQVFVCGTNAFAPQCSWRKADHLGKVINWVPGQAKCPFNPQHNATYIMTSDDNFYSATWTDFTARDPAIYRMMGTSKFLRTAQYNSKWLNEPDFVSSYEIGDFVYFFFRETAVEYINCGKAVFSRVARLCKSDGGGKFLLEDNWTTFVKARLNCSLPGEYPFYFNELQSTYWSEEEKLLYAVFTTSPTSIYGSAVCAYNLSTFDHVFSGAFKYQADPQMAWNRVLNSSPNMQCGGVSNNRSGPAEMNQTPTQRLLVDAQKFQMMDGAVQPRTLEPLVIAENERFTHIIVDQVSVMQNGVSTSLSVMFLATLEGSIKKMIVLPGTSTTCLIEEISLSCSTERKSAIRSIRFDKRGKSLYVGTSDKIYRLAVHRCSRYISKSQCLGAQDPYCGWSPTLGQCAPIGHPNLTSCPFLAQPVNGSWCSWSSWQPCHQTGLLNQDVGQCVCRTRACDCPKPLSGGKTCAGRNVEVTNCTVNGGWTPWSDWSACSATCGYASRTRFRSCTNPQPQNGGRVCVGQEVHVEECPSVKCLFDSMFSPVDGKWSSWSEWSICSVRCGGGHQIRSRTCDNPHPISAGHGCVGNDREFRSCNQAQCEEVRKLGDWSPWLRVNTTRDGFTSERFRCVCKASVPDPTHLRQPQIKTMMRYCAPSGDDCEAGSLSVPDIDGGWSQWSAWTDCDALCGSGTQHRERLCQSPPPSGTGRECTGHSRELRSCNTHSCQGQWSCWSDYGECTGTSCGGPGRRWRKRECAAERPGSYYTLPCRGGDLQEISCITPSCNNGQSDWGEWSQWSSCNFDNLRQRKRNCSAPSTAAVQCYGADIESKTCHYNEIDVLSPEAVLDPSVSNSKRPVAGGGAKFQSYHLLAVGVACFLMGGAVCVTLVVCCWRCGCCKWHASKFDTMRRCDVKQNNYISPLQLNFNSNYYAPRGTGDTRPTGKTPDKQLKSLLELDRSLDKQPPTPITRWPNSFAVDRDVPLFIVDQTTSIQGSAPGARRPSHHAQTHSDPTDTNRYSSLPHGKRSAHPGNSVTKDLISFSRNDDVDGWGQAPKLGNGNHIHAADVWSTPSDGPHDAHSYGTLPRSSVSSPRPTGENQYSTITKNSLPRGGGQSRTGFEIGETDRRGKPWASEAAYGTLPIGGRKDSANDRRPNYDSLNRGDRSKPCTYGKVTPATETGAVHQRTASWINDGKMTVREATLKRNALSRTGSQLRTRLDLYDNDL